MGLGSFPSVSIGQARDIARAHRAKVASGSDPIAARQAADSALAAERRAQQTFAELAGQYIEQHSASWKNPKHESQWAATLRTYAEPVIGSLFVRDISAAHILRVLEPIWTTKTETASRVRGRIELVLDFATARGLRDGPNPARWRGNLDAALPRPTKVAKVQHHQAVGVAEACAFMRRLALQSGTGARALQFAILTAARSGEVRRATWAEMDLAAAMWIVPAERMKGGREHRVPLSAPALALLRSLTKAKPSDLVFPGLRGPLSDMSLTAVAHTRQLRATAARPLLGSSNCGLARTQHWPTERCSALMSQSQTGKPAATAPGCKTSSKNLRYAAGEVGRAASIVSCRR